MISQNLKMCKFFFLFGFQAHSWFVCRVCRPITTDETKGGTEKNRSKIVSIVETEKPLTRHIFQNCRKREIKYSHAYINIVSFETIQWNHMQPSHNANRRMSMSYFSFSIFFRHFHSTIDSNEIEKNPTRTCDKELKEKKKRTILMMIYWSSNRLTALSMAHKLTLCCKMLLNLNIFVSFIDNRK